MGDETKRVEAVYGPYAGSHIDIPADDAEQAIKDGWARDPFAQGAVMIDANNPPPEFDQEKHDKMLVAAEKAARKFRGIDDTAPKGKAGQNRSMEADESGGGYETRRAGRPRKTDE